MTWLAWTAFGVTLYAGLTMVTNVPFYSFKDVAASDRALCGDRGHRAGHCADQPAPAAGAVRALLRAYGLSGYVVYVWRRMKGKPVSVIATSTDEPDEKGLHR
jgi:CDP-diacylglycerol--serine O-phosphatidyltransferase